MGIVQEVIDAFPFDGRPLLLERDEDLLLAPPLPSRKQLRAHPPVEAVHFPPEYIEREFSHPRGIYESDFLRVEWQTMNNRQPFYHRNCDVDEMSFQVAGERTLMTELGTVELTPGDFSRIPVAIAHDNYGRRDIHLLFYVPAPVEELQPAVRTAQPLETPFPGWEAAHTNELITECLGGPEHDIVMAPADERLLLGHADRVAERIRLQRPDEDAEGTTWLYGSRDLLIGRADAAFSDGRTYTRHRNATEIQYQISGTRTLVTQRGSLHLEPGDFVSIPVGIAFTSIHGGPSRHIVLASAREVPRVADATKKGEPITAAEADALRAA
ncbi:hypothetical protein RM780_06520 [Streptomyces sp. DSM 44917]|uniref:Homogentisate 1,2-dioxygenase n=1 Tax=Streptomyces boetiae TaxID=3075541 RepID=A0ABU2L4X8_9ACTN|nr:hypothetical protein [Streptomyces sp. DSM 44917]MDT0306614.1 hypothetical protein [Streptomyces sp. DSM 44917]